MTMVERSGRAWLKRRFGGRVRFGVPMAALTSFRIGGPADVLVEPQSEEELKDIIQWATRENLPYMPLGGGTNLLVRDGGIRGVVILMGGRWAGVDWRMQAGRVALTAQAGVQTRRICAMALRHGWDGTHFALGIPGTLGGAILMNAGTRSGCMADILKSVSVMTPEGMLISLERKAIRSGYRRIDLPSSVLGAASGPPVVVSATLILAPGERDAIRRRAVAVMKRRAAGQPARKPSAGCVFRNPKAMAAGQLIDRCGLKGMTIGGARVSSRHANFIVNDGDATADDVLALMSLIKEAVLRRCGVELIPEVRIVGEE
jgi:UDP-N-acetylmuramate dehydrogenase